MAGIFSTNFSLRILVLSSVWARMPYAQGESPAESADKTGLKEKPQYALNAPLAAGAGMLGFGTGLVGSIVLSIPFCLSENVTVTCQSVSISLAYIGTSIGTGLGVHSVSQVFGLKNDFSWAMVGAFIGCSPFAYFWSKLVKDGAGANHEYQTGALLSFLGGIAIDLIFVYISAIRNENKNIVVGLNMRSHFSESITEARITMRF